MTTIRNEYSENIATKFKWILIFVGLFLINIISVYIVNTDSINSMFSKAIMGTDHILVDLIFPLGPEVIMSPTENFLYIIHILNFCTIFFALDISLKSLAKEQARGSIEYTYMGGISRSDFYLHKLFACILSFISFMVLSTIIGSLVYSIIFGLSLADLILQIIPELILVFFTSLLICSFGVFVSSLMNSLRFVSLIKLLVFVGICISYFFYIRSDMASLIFAFMHLNSLLYFTTGGDFAFYIIKLVIYLVLVIILSYIGITHYNKKDLISN